MLQTSVHFFDMIGKCHSTVSDVAQSFYKKAYKCKKAVYVLLKSTALVAVIITGLAGSAYGDIRSPIAGTVSALHVKTVGAVVQAGTILTEIVPSDIDLVVRAKLQPQDVADVTVGQLARISLSAYDPSRYGALEGEVVHVASNTTEEENQPPYYEMMVQINETTFVNTGETPDIVPGMQVTVDILVGKRTILEYILSPIKKATDVAFRET